MEPLLAGAEEETIHPHADTGASDDSGLAGDDVDDAMEDAAAAGHDDETDGGFGGRFFGASRKYPVQSCLHGTSTVTEKGITDIVAAEKIPAASRARRPPRDEVIPHSEANKAVVFNAFFVAGLRLLVSQLVAGVLEYYSLELPFEKKQRKKISRLFYASIKVYDSDRPFRLGH